MEKPPKKWFGAAAGEGHRIAPADTRPAPATADDHAAPASAPTACSWCGRGRRRTAPGRAPTSSAPAPSEISIQAVSPLLTIVGRRRERSAAASATAAAAAAACGASAGGAGAQAAVAANSDAPARRRRRCFADHVVPLMSGAASQRGVVGFAGADAHGLTDVEHEDLAVADRAGVGGLLDRLDDLRREVVARRRPRSSSWAPCWCVYSAPR